MIKADIRKQHDLYVNNLVGDVMANPKDFYRYVNSQKKDAQGFPPLKKRNGGGVAQSESEKAAEFNGQFTDVFTKSEYSQVPFPDRSAPFIVFAFPFVYSSVRMFVSSFVCSWNLRQSFALKFLKWCISQQLLIRKHSYLDHSYPGGLAFTP